MLTRFEQFKRYGPREQMYLIVSWHLFGGTLVFRTYEFKGT